jgi:hypothetical protein
MNKTRVTVVAVTAAIVLSLLTGVAWAGGRHALFSPGSVQAKGLVTSVAAMHEQMDTMMGSSGIAAGMAGGNGMRGSR